jgi:hypothetical protein
MSNLSKEEKASYVLVAWIENMVLGSLCFPW